MKKVVAYIVLLVLVVVLMMSFVACGMFGSSYQGTYYKYNDGVKDGSDWIKLEKKKWSDDSGESGRLEEKDGVIYGYYEFSAKKTLCFGAQFPTEFLIIRWA